MGRAARTKHERREVARWAQAAELAQRADQAADHVIAHCLAQAFGRMGALDLDALRSLRDQVAKRTAWPSWSWLSNTIFVEDLLATNGIDFGQTDDAELEKYCRLAAAMTTVINWLPGRTVVYYVRRHVHPVRDPGVQIVQDDQVRQAMGKPSVHMRTITVAEPPAFQLTLCVVSGFVKVAVPALDLNAYHQAQVKQTLVPGHGEQVSTEVMTSVLGYPPAEPLKVRRHFAEADSPGLFLPRGAHTFIETTPVE